LHQAALLREVRQWQPNVPLDLEHLIEEVEDLASNAPKDVDLSRLIDDIAERGER
jgi:hypothetical protein